MKPVIKFILFGMLLTIIVAILYYVTLPLFGQADKPAKDPTYQDVVPADFIAAQPLRVLDARDASPLLIPTPGIIRIAHAITKQACPTGHPECRPRALYKWIITSITHRDRLTSRAYIIGPEESIVYREGTDITLSILLVSMLRAEGYDSYLILAPAERAYVNTTILNESFILDPGCSGCGFGSNRLNEPSSIAYIH